MNRYISIFIISILLSISSFAKTAKPESIKEMIEKTGAKNMGSQMVKQILPTFKKLVPNAPESFWIEVTQEINIEEIVELIIPIYQKYLLEEDIQAINKFYDTKTGKKLNKANPNIMKESMIVGQQWGKTISDKIIKKLKEERILK